MTMTRKRYIQCPLNKHTSCLDTQHFKSLKIYQDNSNTKHKYKLCVKLAALSAEWPGPRKTYGPGETRTHDHAFRGHLLYH